MFLQGFERPNLGQRHCNLDALPLKDYAFAHALSSLSRPKPTAKPASLIAPAHCRITAPLSLLMFATVWPCAPQLYSAIQWRRAVLHRHYMSLLLMTVCVFFHLYYSPKSCAGHTHYCKHWSRDHFAFVIRGNWGQSKALNDYTHWRLGFHSVYVPRIV